MKIWPIANQQRSFPGSMNPARECGWRAIRSFLAEDLQQKSLSGSVSDNGSHHQKAAYDNR